MLEQYIPVPDVASVPELGGLRYMYQFSLDNRSYELNKDLGLMHPYDVFALSLGCVL